MGNLATLIDYVEPKFRWIKGYAHIPTITEEGIVWFKEIYKKVKYYSEFDEFGPIKRRNIIKVTTKPTEYILFGDRDAKKI